MAAFDPTPELVHDPCRRRYEYLEGPKSEWGDHVVVSQFVTTHERECGRRSIPPDHPATTMNLVESPTHPAVADQVAGAAREQFRGAPVVSIRRPANTDFLMSGRFLRGPGHDRSAEFVEVSAAIDCSCVDTERGR